jgi:biopolymer transport protein TolR
MGEEVDTDQGKGSETSTELPQLIQAVGSILGANSGQGKSVQVFVRGDKSVPYEAVMKVMGGLQQAGVSNVGLITEAP